MQSGEGAGAEQGDLPRQGVSLVSAIKAEVLAELESLIAEGHRLEGTFNLDGYGYWSKEPEASFHSLNAKARASIARITGTESEFYRALPKQLPAQVTVKNAGGSFVAQITGALEALRHSVDHGLLVTLESRLRANVYDDFLVQAQDVLAAGYHVAAMALVGGVLEDHLMKLCRNGSLTWLGHGSISKYNDLLKDKVYPQTVWRRIQGIGDVRNDADHGNGASVKKDDVEDALKYVQRFLADYP